MTEQGSSAAYDQGYALAAKRLTEAVEERYADLLAAAEGVLPWLAGINTKGDPAMVDTLTDVYGQLAAAIKKAKGQQ